MKLLIAKDISKKYQINKTQEFYALKSTNLSFDDRGLVLISGHSGSGKSTLINLLSKLDKPSSGDLYYNNKSYSSIRGNKENKFRNKSIGIIYQEYHLFSNLNVIQNVIVPALISGVKRKKAVKAAKELLKRFNISEELWNVKAKYLSGGETQRVCIARALINNPKIIFCDEPTGALDSSNSKTVIEYLKEISKSRLVILVSHNLQLTKPYSDRIIELSDGKVVSDSYIKNKESNNKVVEEIKTKRSSIWTNIFLLSNYRKHIKRNIFCVLAFSISLTLLYLVLGFSDNKTKALKDATSKQFAFGSGTISEEVKTSGSGLLSLSKSSRPKLSKLEDISFLTENFHICPNFSAIIPSNIQISYKDTSLYNYNFTPVYSLNARYVDASQIVYASLPEIDNFDEVFINEEAYSHLLTDLNRNPIGETITIKNELITSYMDELQLEVIDVFRISRTLKISGVVKDLRYLSTPKIYYSYSKLSEYLKELLLLNLSTYKGIDISWYDRVLTSDDHSILSSYSYSLFLKDISKKDLLFNGINVGGNLVYSNQSLLVANSLFIFLEVAEYGVILFLIICFIGSILILSIISFTSYSEDRKNSAILSSLGASNEDISSIYLGESIINGVFAIAISSLTSLLFSKIINSLIYNNLDVKDLILIPYSQYLGIRFLFPILILLGVFLVSFIATLLPIFLSKKHSIKGELKTI